MKIDLIASGGGRYRVLRDGAELSAHTAQHTALAAGIAAKQATPASLVEVVTDFRVRVEITGATVPAPTPDHVPDPAPPVVTLPPISKDGTLLRDIAAELSPGEWRRVPTTIPPEYQDFKGFQYVLAIPPATGGADGMGWTERLIEYKGTLMLPLMRDTFEKSLIIMDATGQWHKIRQPEGWSATKSERRPFNRWFRDDEYAYFAPSDAKTAMGYTMRTPLENPGAFERYGIAIGDSGMDTVGNFSMCKAWGRFWAYTPGGRLRSWAEGEAAWDNNYSHIPSEYRNSGYAGTVIYNPIRDEVITIGGQTFGSNEDVSYRGLRVRSADARSEPFQARWEDGAPVMVITAGSSRFMHHARTGEYLMLYRDGRMYRSETGEVWRPYEDLTTLKPWGRYEQYCPWTYLENTDVIVMVSHIMGVWLHKIKD